MSVKKYGVKEFEELKTSTRTIMVYTNTIFDHEKIFNEIDITPIEVPRTKKKKNVDKKNLKAPYGSIISIHKGDKFRGVNLRKNKTRYCSVCQPVKENITDYLGSKKQKKINTVVEKTVHVKGTDDVKEISYYCNECLNEYNYGDLDKTPTHFLNQVTIALSLERVILNVMIFKDNFKIAGCKEDNDAVEAIMILWQEYISLIKDSFQIKEKFKDEKSPRFLFQLVMRNVDFRLGFPVDRQKLNELLNGEKYSDKIAMSQCEPTGNTNVNIKMIQSKPKNFEYDCLVIPQNEKPYFIKHKKKIYRSKKKKKTKHITFIVFSSSEVILSGRYEEKMKEMYQFFIEEAFKNRDIIEEKIRNPKESLYSHLSKIEN
jgi:hypothetical protein